MAENEGKNKNLDENTNNKNMTTKPIHDPTPLRYWASIFENVIVLNFAPSGMKVTVVE